MSLRVVERGSGPHSQAATDPVFWQLFNRRCGTRGPRLGAVPDLPRPVATVGREIAWFGPDASGLELSPVARESVTCDFYHTISGQENLGQGRVLEWNEVDV